MGFGYWVQQPGNTTVRKLLSEDRYVTAFLDFLRAMRVRKSRRASS